MNGYTVGNTDIPTHYDLSPNPKPACHMKLSLFVPLLAGNVTGIQNERRGMEVKTRVSLVEFPISAEEDCVLITAYQHRRVCGGGISLLGRGWSNMQAGGDCPARFRLRLWPDPMGIFFFWWIMTITLQ